MATDLQVENQRNFRKLVLSIKASYGQLNLLIAECDQPHYRAQLIQAYETELAATGTHCHQIKLDAQQPSLKQSLLALVAQEAAAGRELGTGPTVVTVLGASELLGIRLSQEPSAQERFFFSLQWTRESLQQFQCPIVLWLTTRIGTALSQQAQDFWIWRGGWFTFAQPQPLPENLGQADRVEANETSEEIADPTELQQQIQALLAQDPESPLLASLYQSLGIAYRQRTEQGQAIDYAQEQQLAIDALQAAISRQFPLGESPTLASSLNNLAVLYESQGRYGEAEPLFTQALDLRQRQLGPDHPHTQIVRENLGGLRQQIQATGQTEQSL